MEKQVLFISETEESFLITALEKSLANAGYRVVFCPPHPREIDSIPNRPNIFLVYLDGDETRYNTTLEYLAELVRREKPRPYLFLIGNPIEIETAYKIVNRDLVTTAFQRPVNTTDLINDLNLAASGYSYEDRPDSVEYKYASNGSRKSLLLVDDDSTLLRSMQNWLAKKYNVFITNSGMNTISFLRERAVDLILLDYEMPVLSGLEVFQILKSEPATEKIPVIFLTSKDDKSIVVKVLEAKPVGYLLKPMPPAMLVKAVDDFFKKQEEERHAPRRERPKPAAHEEELEELEALD